LPQDVLLPIEQHLVIAVDLLSVTLSIDAHNLWDRNRSYQGLGLLDLLQEIIDFARLDEEYYMSPSTISPVMSLVD
jgi:hypothetical protein